MDCRKYPARIFAFALIAAMAGASGAAQKAAEKKVESEPPQAAPTPGNTMGYGVKLGGFFTDKHKVAAKRSFQKHFAKMKECPKDMEREGKTCRALVKGHYWAVGQPLQKAVEAQPVPDDVIAALPPPPEGYEYVRAGEDILLMSKAIHLVVDVMEDVVG